LPIVIQIEAETEISEALDDRCERGDEFRIPRGAEKIREELLQEKSLECRDRSLTGPEKFREELLQEKN
jgi:hypothetical protein